MFLIRFFSSNGLRDFMSAFAFCPMVPPFEKITEKKAENNLFQLCFTFLKCFVFVICRHFTTLKWLKVSKLSKICLQMIKAMTPKTTDQNIWFLNELIRTNLHCRFNECGIKLQILNNNYFWINLVSTRHLRPRYAKHKMLLDDSCQKIWRNMCLQVTIMH